MPTSTAGEHDAQRLGSMIKAFICADVLQIKPSTGDGDDPEPSAADNLKSLVQECGVSLTRYRELLQELPPTRISDVLIDYYFTTM